MAHTNTWESSGLYRKFTGAITSVEILESNLELHGHPEFEKIKYIINDFSEVTGHTVVEGHTRAYATSDDMVSITKGRMKIAIVVDKDPLIAFAHAYQEQMQGKIFECEVFQSLAEAREWVRVPL